MGKLIKQQLVDCICDHEEVNSSVIRRLGSVELRSQEEMALDTVVSKVAEMLIDVVKDEVAMILGVPKEIEKLQRSLQMINCVLEDAERKRVDSKSIDGWLRNLKDVMNSVGIAKTFIDLESKKWKVIQGGASADSVRVCTICNVVCNSDKVFASHVAGRKHALKAIGVSPLVLKPKVPAHLKALLLANKAIRPTPKSAAKTAAKSFVTFVQSSYCDVCKIDCNSQEVLNNHKMGKKHMKNKQKLQASITPNPASAPVKNVIQKDASVAGQAKAVAAPPTKEELETKKQKVLHGGDSAAAVRVCDLCNVVCNSEIVFNSHIAGQKHMSMVNKQ